jgi:hypothetical protein
MPRAEPAARTVKFFRTFRSYAAHQERMKKKALSSIEESGVAAALERCSALAERIDAELREKKPKRLDIAALAEFQVSLERAASVLRQGSIHPPQSSSASRFTAGASGFLNLSQSGERPDR